MNAENGPVAGVATPLCDLAARIANAVWAWKPRRLSVSALRLLLRRLHPGQFDLVALLLLLAQLVLADGLGLFLGRRVVHRQGQPGRGRRLASLALELDIQAQFVGRIGIADRLVVTDEAFVVELEQRPVEGAHAQLARLGHDAL